MKRNLKKAISAVIALALSASLVPASFAAKLVLSDVADTASYATAVNTLVALDVINGYEDGTFLPDNLITRAEATKVMVAALNQLDAAEGMKGSTQFTDVEAKHEWATGYINAGVQNGYINGMGDGTFAPDANVTYAQMVKMLVSAMGYDDYATYMGGYPDGYLAIASTEGITKNVSANKAQNVTRAQVAQLVYNALLAPIVSETGIEWTDNGQLRPKIEKMDGTYENGAYKAYKSLLTEKFDAFYVEGYVTATAKDGGLEKDQVNFGIAKAERYDDENVGAGNFTSAKALTTMDAVLLDANRVHTVYVGETDAADYKGTYASAILAKDEYEDYTMISFQPSGKNKSVVVDVALLDDDANSTFAGSTDMFLNIFANESATKSTKYNLETDAAGTSLDVDVYVNGVKIAATTDAQIRTAIDTYVVKAAAGEVELVDTYKTNGYYDAIYVNSYVTAMVDSVISSSKKIAFKNCTAKVATLTLDEEANENLDYKIYYNGEEISLLELQENDILSIVCEPNNFANSDFYEIYVSRNVQTGSVTAMSSDGKEITIGGEVYSFVGDVKQSDFAMRSEYVVYVDAFGRIYSKELNATATKYAILDAYLVDNNKEYAGNRVRLYTAEGEVKTLVLDVTTAEENAVKGIKDNALTGRVVTYSVSTKTGYVNSIAPCASKDNTTDSFVASRNRVGSIAIGDATKVIDAIKYTDNGVNARYTDLALGSLSSFVDDGQYTIYAYGTKTDGAYPLVVVTKGDAKYNEDTHFAVVSGGLGTGVEEDMDVTYIPVSDADADKTLVGSDELAMYKNGSLISTLDIGDVIVYTTDAAGYVERIDVIFEVASDYKTMVDNVIAGSATAILPSDLAGNGFSADWKAAFNSSADAIQLVVGAVVAKNSDNFSIATIKNGQTDVNKINADGGVYDIDLTSDTVVYTYDYTKSEKTRVEKGVIGSVINSIFTKESYVNKDADAGVIDWADAGQDDTADNHVKANVNLVFAKVIDNEATDVFVITGEYK